MQKKNAQNEEDNYLKVKIDGTDTKREISKGSL